MDRMAPAYFGNLLGYLVLGVILVQTCTDPHPITHTRSQLELVHTDTYHTRFSTRDAPLLRAFVYAAVVLQLGESGVETYVGYYYLVRGFKDLQGTLARPPKALIFQPVFDACCELLLPSHGG